MYSIYLYAHAAAFLAYGIFAALLVFLGARTWLSTSLAVAAAATGLWAGIVVLDDLGKISYWLVPAAASARDGAWFAVLLALLKPDDRNRVLWRRLAAVAASMIAIDAAMGISRLQFETPLGIRFDFAATQVGVAIVGLILIENILRNISRERFWSVKLLGIGLGGIFLFDLVARIPEILRHEPDDALRTALPLIYILVLPLFVVTAIRTPRVELRIHSSRQVVFHTAALVGLGILLEGMALASVYVRNYGGSSGTIVALVFLFAGLIGFAVAGVSGSFRSRVRLFINENFFSYKYDYRVEWSKFIRSLSAWDEGGVALRVLRTFAELLDSPGGALWVWRDSWRQFLPAAKWSVRTEIAPVAPGDAMMKPFEDEGIAYIEVSDGNDAAPDIQAVAKLWHDKYPFAWLVIPLRYRSSLAGVAVLNKPRARRALNWEDSNLISLVALQLAVYLVQEETAQALADARQLEDFNRRVAFIIHDIKNTIGQLSLVVRNAGRFGHEEEFRKDMVSTIRHSVDQLQELLARLKGEGGPKAPVAAPAAPAGVDVAGLVSDFVSRKRKFGLNIVLRDAQTVPLLAGIDNQDALVGVLEHVVTNAVEAAPEGSPVRVGIEKIGDKVRICVDDDGAGMSPRFIADELFRPLRTTKGGGFGIGAYQAKETMRDLGGDLEVLSKIGEGTSVTLLLPVC